MSKNKNTVKDKVRKAVSTVAVATAIAANNALSSRAVCMKLSVSCFIGNPRDKKITAETEADHGTEAKRLSVRKKTYKSKELDAAITGAQSIRLAFARLTLPWLESVRIIASPRLIEAKTEIETMIREWKEKTVAAFIANLPAIEQSDKKALNGAYNPNDYYSADEMASKFNASVELVPVSTDFRVEGIEQAQQEALQSEILAQTSQRLAETKTFLLDQIREELAHLAERLGGKKPNGDSMGFKGSSIQNVLDACSNAVTMAVLPDANVESIAATVKSVISTFDADKIRDSKEAREEATKIATSQLEEITKAMEAFAG